MTRFEVEINGKMRTVAVEPVAGTEGRFRVLVDDKERLVEFPSPSGEKRVGLASRAS